MVDRSGGRAGHDGTRAEGVTSVKMIRAGGPETSDGEAFADTSLTLPFLAVANRLTLLATREIREITGLTLTEWRVLMVLTQFPGTSASNVVRLVMVDKSVASRAIARLETNGLIVVAANPFSAREKKLSLTQPGTLLHDRVLPRSTLLLPLPYVPETVSPGFAAEARGVKVVNVIILRVEEVEDVHSGAPRLVEFVADLQVHECRRRRAGAAVFDQIAWAEVTQP